jgi:nitrite reductase/ring-hydroxylating ferredoxin subunit
MAGFTVICKTSDVPDGEVRAFSLAGTPIAIYHLDGAFYATEDRCSHGLASLSEGIIDGDVIECPLHFGAFNIKTGAAAAPPCSIAIRTFQVREEDGQLLVEAPA